MITLLLVLVLIVLCFIARELVVVRRRVSNIRQFLEWAAIGFLETRDLTPEQREFLEKAKETLIRNGGFNRQQADFLNRI